MSDLVEQLRDSAKRLASYDESICGEDYNAEKYIEWEAADEITRLESELREAKAAIKAAYYEGGMDMRDDHTKRTDTEILDEAWPRSEAASAAGGEG